MNIGDRVIHIEDGLIGIIEGFIFGDDWCDVRWQTPNDVPSCLISTCPTESLKVVPAHIKPMPFSKEKQAEADKFFEVIMRAIEEAK